FAELLGPLGMPVAVLGDEPGEAATRKLLRSVFFKGIAAAVLESLEAAEAAGCEDWLREDIAGIFASAADGDGFVERLVTGSRPHAVRRTEEMLAAAALVEELGVEPDVSRAAARVLARLAELAAAPPD